MSTHAVKIDKLWTSVEGKVRVVPTDRTPGKVVYFPSHARTSQAELLILGLILATLQVLDGILTGVGMAQYGTSMEGNALLRALMGYIGYIPALVITKGAAILIIAALCQQALRVHWLKYAFATIIVLYVALAIGPWTYLLGRDLLG